MLDIKEYPADFMMRNNQYAPMYCDIALEAYYEARKIFNTMTAAKWLMADPAVDYRMPEKVHKKVATAVVFSALAAEAFINDYLATRLGDKVFYGAYNTSDVHYYQKLDKIMTVILKVRHHQDYQWYQDVRSLFDLRNAFVHSTSSEVSADEFIDLIYSDNESKAKAKARVAAIPSEHSSQSAKFHAILNQEELDDSWEVRSPKVADLAERKRLRDGLEDARFALTTLCNLTKQIEKLDPNSRAFSRTFNENALEWGEADEMEIRMAVFPEIGIPIESATAKEKSSPK